MKVDVEGSKPDTDISPDGQWAVLHLTRNADPIIAGDKTKQDFEVSGINISGTVDVHLRQGETVQNTEFHFIQLAADMHWQASFWGRTSNDGFMTFNAADPPAFPQKFAFDYNLDSLADRMPFMNLRQPGIFPKRNNRNELVPGTTSIFTDLDDHPNGRVRVAFKNVETNAVNFLGEVLIQKKFLTAFVARDLGTKKITPLAHVGWWISWEAKYRWAQSKCFPYPVNGKLEVSPVTKGALNEAGSFKSGTAAKFTNPTTNPGETANELMKKSRETLGAHPRFLNIVTTKKWPAYSPANFWTD
jgi:hypothetical protein